MRLWHSERGVCALEGFITSRRDFNVAGCRWCDGGEGNVTSGHAERGGKLGLAVCGSGREQQQDCRTDSCCTCQPDIHCQFTKNM
ncbi:hypothetical protein M3J09_010552 [Ascochyta lentis]